MSAACRIPGCPDSAVVQLMLWDPYAMRDGDHGSQVTWLLCGRHADELLSLVGMAR